MCQRENSPQYAASVIVRGRERRKWGKISRYTPLTKDRTTPALSQSSMVRLDSLWNIQSQHFQKYRVPEKHTQLFPCLSVLSTLSYCYFSFFLRCCPTLSWQPLLACCHTHTHTDMPADVLKLCHIQQGGRWL